MARFGITRSTAPQTRCGTQANQQLSMRWKSYLQFEIDTMVLQNSKSAKTRDFFSLRAFLGGGQRTFLSGGKDWMPDDSIPAALHTPNLPARKLLKDKTRHCHR